MKLRSLTRDEKQAVLDYAAKYGRTWKEKLRHWWMNPGVVTDEPTRLLYCLRNTHGTAWLARVSPKSLKKMNAAELKVAIDEHCKMMASPENQAAADALAKAWAASEPDEDGIVELGDITLQEIS